RLHAAHFVLLEPVLAAVSLAGHVDFFRIRQRHLLLEDAAQRVAHAFDHRRDVKPDRELQPRLLEPHSKGHFPPPVSTPTAATAITLASASGTSLFHPRFMSWLYLKRGRVHRMITYTNRIATTLAMKTPTESNPIHHCAPSRNR